MGKFWLIAGIEHTASKWLATVLDAQEGWRATHELKQQNSGMPWQEALRYEQRNGAESAQYRSYWTEIQEALSRYEVVGDSNSWVPMMLPAVHAYQPIDRLIYLVRHGISQLHSLATQSAIWRAEPLDSYALNEYLQFYHGLLGEPEPEWESWGRWERLCLLWAGSVAAIDYLKAEGLPVEVHTFEALTQTPGLQKLLPKMTAARTLYWRRRDINRKVEGSRRPVDLWPTWTAEQREAFIRICGEPMARMGYEIPGEG